MTQTPKQFNPAEHFIQLKSKNGMQDYLPVQWRLVWLREVSPDAQIETELIHLDLDKETEEEVFQWNQEKRKMEKVVKRAKGVAIFKATVRDGKGGIATGTKMEKASAFADFIEKAETGAIGRALAALGYGTQFTGDELNEHHRIVDSPVACQEGQEPSATEGTDDQAQTETLDSIKADVRTLGLVRNPEQWTQWKKSIVKKNLADQDLTPAHLGMMRDVIDQEKKRRTSNAA